MRKVSPYCYEKDFAIARATIYRRLGFRRGVATLEGTAGARAGARFNAC
jgi:hypothetical protein